FGKVVIPLRVDRHVRPLPRHIIRSVRPVPVDPTRRCATWTNTSLGRHVVSAVPVAKIARPQHFPSHVRGEPLSIHVRERVEPDDSDRAIGFVYEVRPIEPHVYAAMMLLEAFDQFLRNILSR